MGTRVVFEGRVGEVDSRPCVGSGGAWIVEGEPRREIPVQGAWDDLFRWPWLFRNLVVRLRLSWEEREECKLTSQAMKR